MFSLEALLGQEQGGQALGEISSSVGAEPSAVSSAIQLALPALINGLATNASTEDGAASLDNALTRDHDGSIFDNLGGLGGLIMGQLQTPEPTPKPLDAGGILGHILGANQGAVAAEVSKRTGLGMGQAAQILMMLAPIVMGYLGRQKQEQGIGADGLGGLIGSLIVGTGSGQTDSSGNAMLDMASSMLDRDRDGSAMDDIASMALKYMTNRG